MKKLLITLGIIVAMFATATAQQYTIGFDSVYIKSPLRLGSITTGNSTDSILTKKANGRVFKVAQTALLTTASNGLTKTGVDIQLGGSLLANTSVDVTNKDLLLYSSSTPNTGMVSVGAIASTAFGLKFSGSTIDRGIYFPSGQLTFIDANLIGGLYSTSYATEGKKRNLWLADWGTIKLRVDSALTFVGTTYFPFTGGTITGVTNITNATSSKLRLQQSAASQANFVQFLDDTGTQTGFVGHGSGASTTINLNSTTGSVVLATNNITRITVGTASVASTLPFTGATGTALLPSLSFSGDPNTGMWNNSADAIGFTTGGVNRVTVNSSGITLATALNVSSNAAPTVGDHLTNKTYVDGVDALKAPLASPPLTGVPTAPTASATDNTTQIATTAHVKAFANSLTVTDAAASPYTKATLNSTYPSAPIRFKVVCPTISTVYEKYDATNWFSVPITVLP